ncbi:hypothetical protein NDU88_003519 [Pleurodeles waltl]|uniref:Uncharacterized protein n=1 Tax=Pleurodeles waltl TaxID=8319 RepID=A0AAV7MQS4_PLEWA|nr:hypothetical protein NDU88_003519 [Pleurodeles waltl]
MGTLSEASDPDFGVRPRKETTDSQEGVKRRESGEEERKEKTPSRGSRTLDPRREPNTRTAGFLQDWRTEGCAEQFPKSPEINASKPSHDPGGSWLSKHSLDPKAPEHFITELN